ncbi:MAG TPA: polysaccharide biosynthesis/export family protein [Gammaproteobacteria bacterium]|nr:polysaccharide biosynthesis/export family protein [Gammaproteobacteria bacterium]
MFLLLVAAGGASAWAASEPAYHVHPGDVLTISVWNEKDLQGDTLVRPDGGLSFPLVGNLQAAGKTIPQIQKEVASKLSKFIPDPSVTVALKQNNGNLVYVIGQVNKPGQYPVNRYVDVVQALSMAGGMTPYAATGKIKILRRENGKVTAIHFDYGEVEKGENLKQDIVLQSGDVVLVP